MDGASTSLQTMGLRNDALDPPNEGLPVKTIIPRRVFLRLQAMIQAVAPVVQLRSHLKQGFASSGRGFDLALQV